MQILNMFRQRKKRKKTLIKQPLLSNFRQYFPELMSSGGVYQNYPKLYFSFVSKINKTDPAYLKAGAIFAFFSSSVKILQILTLAEV